ncbi:helix-turn-helix transcriptional regulator [Spirosoma luteum]|uniref:helix-turn-helix transcriptional regulator n=1 Tax=Spirosoma luteum TaxID=431553 RepID=UPI00036B73C7|nr:helix-turn-helix transcriptional regulator [Spirosoma luteum]
MTINDKIKQILIEKNLTPSYFADEIGVQRSSISHILSGRNRPSFDIIQKIIRRFPELGYEWIMEEENQPGLNDRQMNSSGSNYTNRGVGRPAQNRSDQFNTVQPGVSYAAVPQPTSVRSQRTEIPPQNMVVQADDNQASEPFTANASGEKKVERILIFYTDGSFREFTPTV